MIEMKIKDVIDATGGKLISGNPNDTFCDIERDSRANLENKLFIALVGENFDGNDFVDSALKNGAKGVIVSREMKCDTNVILVDDTKRALGQIAAYYRKKFDIPFIGITGSVGKTTTKDMITCVLSSKYKVLSTAGNFNNEIGLPLTLFKLDKTHQIGVTEMGMSGFGEIDRLSKMVTPDCGVYTNIGLSHVEKLGSRENILKAKSEMLNNLKPDGFVVLSGDDDMLLTLKDKIKQKYVYYGISNSNSDVYGFNIKNLNENKTSFDVTADGKTVNFVIPVLGEHNVKNALAAIAVGLHYGVSLENAREALSKFVPGKMRQNIIELKGITVINDCYNASPSSVEAGLKILNQIAHKARKIAILGDMLEMGDLSETAHKTVGGYVVANKADFLITVGKSSRNIAKGAIDNGFDEKKIRSFDTIEQANAFTDSFLEKGDVVLVKASRGMKFEEIVEHIIEF